jgi:hypothetical protein
VKARISPAQQEGYLGDPHELALRIPKHLGDGLANFIETSPNKCNCFFEYILVQIEGPSPAFAL